MNTRIQRNKTENTKNMPTITNKKKPEEQGSESL